MESDTPLTILVNYLSSYLDFSLKGELAALTAAFLWAASSIIYSLLGSRIAPLTLNLLKGLVAIALIMITLAWQRAEIGEIEKLAVLGLMTSGVIGIGLGDTAYFLALNTLGPRRTLLVETLSPPLGGLLAWIWLGETLKPQAWLGILLTTLGVAWVISERTVNSDSPQQNQGIIWALGAAIAQATGAVISRAFLLDSPITPLASTLLRLTGAVLSLLPLIYFNRFKTKNVPQRWSVKLMGVIILTAFGSTYLGIWLQQTSLKFSPVGIAQTLLATSPLFILPLARCLGEKISFRSLAGVLLAVGGIALLSYKGR